MNTNTQKQIYTPKKSALIHSIIYEKNLSEVNVWHLSVCIMYLLCAPICWFFLHCSRIICLVAVVNVHHFRTVMSPVPGKIIISVHAPVGRKINLIINQEPIQFVAPMCTCNDDAYVAIYYVCNECSMHLRWCPRPRQRRRRRQLRRLQRHADVDIVSGSNLERNVRTVLRTHTQAHTYTHTGSPALTILL